MHRKLPDGTVTTNDVAYGHAWELAVEPLLRATGWTLTGFDPAVLLDTGNGVILHLNTTQVAALVKALAKGSEP
jgi:hypothetical protein